MKKCSKSLFLPIKSKLSTKLTIFHPISFEKKLVTLTARLVGRDEADGVDGGIVVEADGGGILVEAAGS